MRRTVPPSSEAPESSQGSLFENIYVGAWPSLWRFPTNSERPRVAGVVGEDLARSLDPLVITGYASLDRLVIWLAECYARLSADPAAHRSIRLLLGNEPYPTERQEFRLRRHSFSREVQEYWLEHGVSLHLSAQVIAALELLRGGRAEVRISGKQGIHAKIYVGDDAITLGSSNFTASGLERQIEANIRLTPAEDERWREGRGLAEEIWRTGVDFRAELERLLEQLLRCVRWQEALARACGELLEGDWAERLRDAWSIEEGHRLWPSQEQGISHALWVLEHQGSVLVADATGSGKTLMGSHLIKRVMTRLARTGRGRSELAVLMAPPAVLPDWERHAAECGAMLHGYSQGHLSHHGSVSGENLQKYLRRTQVLAIDEAHNFLRRSKRTTALFSNIADHVLLFTATPVNRGPRDMLAMIDLLGADNLEEETLEVLKRLWSRRANLSESMSAEEREKLRGAIRRFTVRRTKVDLNRLVERDPERYRDPSGRVCRYPEHRPRTYECSEPTEDLELATRIREAASRLRGLTRFAKPLELPELLRREGITEERYLAGRLRGAAALAAHEVAAGLRSSRVRLLEHLRGTESVLAERPALRRTRVAPKPGVIDQLSKLSGRPPLSRLGVELPEWLRDPAAHRKACEEELAAYEEIEALIRRVSDTRERAKVALLRRLVREHRLVLAFDSYLITLADLRDRLVGEDQQDASLEIIVATGDAVTARRRLYQQFRPGSGARGIVALCSDALAEGVNLQEASVVVMLDMPSVIRVAEQRIGRVDRMNSPHDVIEAYWPLDPPPFAVRASERLAERLRFVAQHLGSNFELPAVLAGDGPDTVVSYEDYVAQLEAAAKGRGGGDELQDAFAPVRALVEGDRVIVPADVYKELRQSRARVVSAVSVVQSRTPFAFLAIAGTEWGAPRWVYLAGPGASPMTDLDDICGELRANLTLETRDLPLDATAASSIDRVLSELEMHEESLLPRGKQRALTEMRFVLKKYRREDLGDVRRRQAIDDLLDLADGKHEGGAVDRAALADWWLRTIQPVKFRHLQARARVRPLLLRDLRKELLRTPIKTEQLEQAFETPLFTQPIHERVVAAIVGLVD